MNPKDMAMVMLGIASDIDCGGDVRTLAPKAVERVARLRKDGRLVASFGDRAETYMSAVESAANKAVKSDSRVTRGTLSAAVRDVANLARS